jgi:hypothetical protein
MTEKEGIKSKRGKKYTIASLNEVKIAKKLVKII